jgi:hypothetical protein
VAPPPVLPPGVGSPGVARAGTTIWFAAGSPTVVDLNWIFRRFGSGTGVVRSLSTSAVDWIVTIGSVLVDVDDVLDDVVLEVLDVVGPADVDVDDDVDVDGAVLVELVLPTVLVDVLVVLVDVVLPIVLVDVDEVVAGALVDVDGTVDDVVVLLLVLAVVELLVLDDVELLLEVDEVDGLVLLDVDVDGLVLVLLLLDVDELLLVEDDDDVDVDEVVVVVVGAPHVPVGGDTLAGFAGSVPHSISRVS